MKLWKCFIRSLGHGINETYYLLEIHLQKYPNRLWHFDIEFWPQRDEPYAYRFHFHVELNLRYTFPKIYQFIGIK